MAQFIVRFYDTEGRDRSATVEAEDYGEPVARAVEELGGVPESIYSVWKV